MIKATMVFCFVMLEVIAVMYCNHALSKGYAGTLLFGFIVADVLFCIVYIAESVEKQIKVL